MKMTPTTFDRKNMKKGLKSPAPASVLALMLALLLVLCSLPVYADEQQTEQPETPTVTQDTGSESAQSVTSSEQDEIIIGELDIEQSIEQPELEVAATTELTEDPPHEGAVLHGGYVGFKNKASGKYLTIPNGSTSTGTNVCQRDENGIINSQEFYLAYTHNKKKNISYFTIYSVNMSGETVQTRIKAGDVSVTSQANVSLQYFLPTEITDRWQIAHYADNYYIIYMDSRPSNSTTRYVMRATEGQGTQDGTDTFSQGNVYVAAFDIMATPSDKMLWEICVDGEPVNINSNDITQYSEQIVDIGDSIDYYYIPQSFNCTVTWGIQGSATMKNPGTVKTNDYGTADISCTVTQSNTSVVKSSRLRMLPPNGVYFYLENAESGKYVDIEGSSLSSNAYIEQNNYKTGNTLRWEIVHDIANPSYVRFKSVYSGLYLAVNVTDLSIVQSSLENDCSLWKINDCSNGNKVLYCKATESNGRVLLVPNSLDDSGLNLMNSIYVLDSNCRDEWILHVSTDASLIALPEAYDRSSFFSGVLDELESVGYTKNYHNHDTVSDGVTQEQLLKYLEQSRITLIRTHGSRTDISVSDGFLSMEDLSVLPTNYLIRSELIVYGACLTASQSTGSNLVNATIQRGARTVIGFEDPIGSDACNFWCEKFFEKYADFYDNENKTIQDACKKADTHVKIFHNRYYSFTMEDGRLATIENYVIAGEIDFPD